jgi:DNA-directed RNA polymerase III subunit RPC3
VVWFQEIPKTPDYAPSRTFYLFSVQLLPVAIMVRERCYKALGNLIVKAVAETTENK